MVSEALTIKKRLILCKEVQTKLKNILLEDKVIIDKETIDRINDEEINIINGNRNVLIYDLFKGIPTERKGEYDNLGFSLMISCRHSYIHVYVYETKNFNYSINTLREFFLDTIKEVVISRMVHVLKKTSYGDLKDCLNDKNHSCIEKILAKEDNYELLREYEKTFPNIAVD